MLKLHQLQPSLYMWIIAEIEPRSLKMGVLRLTRGQGQRGQMHKILTYSNETRHIYLLVYEREEFWIKLLLGSKAKVTEVKCTNIDVCK